MEKVSKNEFDRAVMDNRHKELISILKQLAVQPEKTEPNKELQELLLRNRIAIDAFVEKLKELSSNRPQDVKVETNQDKVVSSLNDMANRISQELASLKEILLQEPKEWSFKIKRDYSGFIESVIVNPK